MCGIAGMQGRVDRALLERMQASIRHRGPDSEGLYAAPERGIGLAHTRLSILDLSPQGAQPMASDCGGVHIVYNGETYNSPALRDELESDGVTFRGRSDTEVILRLYLRDGESFLKRLNGIFALGIWDDRCQELLVARDGLGVKPL